MTAISTNYFDVQRRIEVDSQKSTFDLAHTYANPIIIGGGAATPTDGTDTVQTTGATTEQEKAEESKKSADDKNDGKIGFWKATGNFFKGVGNFFWGMVSDEQGNFDIGQTLKTVAIGAGLAALAFFVPGAGTALAAGFLAMGVIHSGKAVYDIATAKTDEEDELAWQNLGSGATETALAAVACKQTGAFGKTAKATKAVYKSGENIYKGYKTGGYELAKARAKVEFGKVQKGVKSYTGKDGKIAQQWKSLTENSKLDLEALKSKGTESTDVAYNEGIEAIKGKNQADALRAIKQLQEEVRTATADTKEAAQAKLDGAKKAYNTSTQYRQYEITDKTARETEMNRLNNRIEKYTEKVTERADRLAQQEAELAKNPGDTRLQAEVDKTRRSLSMAQEYLEREAMAKKGIEGPTIRETVRSGIKEGTKTPGYRMLTITAAGRGYKEAA